MLRLGIIAAFFMTVSFQAMGQSFTGYDIMIVAGQSNATGLGTAVVQDDLLNDSVNSKIFQLGRCGSNNLNIIAAKDSLDHFGCVVNDNRRGFALPFARRYAKYILPAGRRLLIIPAAKNGSSIMEWDPLVSARPTMYQSRDYYEDTLSRAQYALGLHSGNRVVGFHWQQGETDMKFAYEGGTSQPAQMMQTYQDYEVRLRRLINGLRGNLPSTYMSILVGDPSREAPYRMNSFASIMRTVAESYPCSGFISSQGLTSTSTPAMIGDDLVHFTGDGQIEMGKRRYNLYASFPLSCRPQFLGRFSR